MAEFDGFPAGRMCWVDLSTPDINAAINFYGQLFGWTPEAEPSEEFAGYTNMLLNGKRVAGIAPLMSEEQPIVWSTYVAVDDASKTTEIAREAGGTVIVEPMTVGDLGSFAFYIDTAGAAVGVWQSGTHKGVQVANEPNSWSWSELNCRNTEAAKSFYSAVFGWADQKNESSSLPYWNFMHNDDVIAGLMEMPPQVPEQVPSFWLNYFSVADIDASCAKLTELGGNISMPRTEIAIGSFAVVSDPQGATFSFFQAKQ